MAVKTFKARIKINSSVQEVMVQADNFFNAKAMLEAQYGKGCIFSSPVEVRK